MIILLIGPQGSGKGTEGKLLSEALHLPLIGVGELLRNIPKSHPKYLQINASILKGELVDFETTADVIKARILNPDCANGYILDGWLRAISEMYYFDPKPDFVLYFNVPLEETIKRIAGRRICALHGEVLNIHTSPKEDLEKCKNNLITRKDDTEEVVLNRQHMFDTDAIPVVNMYRGKGNLLEIDALGSIEDVHNRVLKALEISQLKN